MKSKPKVSTPPKKTRKPALDPATKAWVATVTSLGRLRRGTRDPSLKGTELVKAIFQVNRRMVMELWEVYTQRRDELSRKLINNQAYTVAYLLGFHLANVARSMDLFTRSNKRHHWNKLCAKSPVRLYDIGCGTGAMSAAYLQSAKATEVLLYDSSGPLLDAASELHKQLGTKNLRTSRKQIEDFDTKWFRSPDPETIHVYLFGYVWNELQNNNPARRRLMDILTGHVQRDEKCLIFIAEPAQEFTSRPTMELRDLFCEAGFIALYPCPHSAACPMLPRPKDWCYSEGVWDQPDIAGWIDEKLELDRRNHAATLFAFASPKTGLASDQMPIVVGRPVKEDGVERYKGFFDYLVCAKDKINKVAPTRPKTVVLRGEDAKNI